MTKKFKRKPIHQPHRLVHARSSDVKEINQTAKLCKDIISMFSSLNSARLSVLFSLGSSSETLMCPDHLRSGRHYWSHSLSAWLTLQSSDSTLPLPEVSWIQLWSFKSGSGEWDRITPEQIYRVGRKLFIIFTITEGTSGFMSWLTT